jgi:hypothetical protein
MKTNKANTTNNNGAEKANVNNTENQELDNVAEASDNQTISDVDKTYAEIIIEKVNETNRKCEETLEKVIAAVEKISKDESSNQSEENCGIGCFVKKHENAITFGIIGTLVVGGYVYARAHGWDKISNVLGELN